MATPFDRLMTTIRPHLPGAVDEGIKQELYMTCIEFLTWSTAWREEIEFDVSANTTEGELVPYAGRVEKLMYVTKDGYPVRHAYLENGYVKFRYPSPNNESYKATVALNITDPMTRDAYPIIPYEIVSRYTDELMHGVISRMMSQPSKPWTNLSLAQWHLLKFKGGTSRARNNTNLGDTQGSQKWTFPQTFANR